MKYIVWILLLCVTTVSAQQKNDRDYIRSGNRLYKDSLYSKAEVDYRKAIERNVRSSQAYYNLGNALFRQQKPKEAMEAYETAVKVEANKIRLSKMYHNMGVILQSQKQFAPAIECYKNALRRNPYDDETRYNLVLCQHQLENSPQDNSNDKNQQENQDKDKQQQDQQQKEEDQNENNKQQKQPSQSQQQEEKGGMSKENIEQMLQAAMQDEKATQEKVKKAMTHPRKRRLQKEW